MIDGAPNGSLGLATQSGWMNSELFPKVPEHFIEHIGVPVTKRGVLVTDNHESHISVEVMYVYCFEMAQKKGLSIVTFPPHCSHRMQPLGVRLYGPFKRHFNTDALSHPANTIFIYDVAEFSGQAFGKAFSHCSITSSFKATGIYPMNRNIFNDDAFLSAAVTDRCVGVNTPATEPAPSTSQGSPAASTSQGSPAASTRKGSTESSERHTPEDLWPYPKAALGRQLQQNGEKENQPSPELLHRRKVNIVIKPKRVKKTCLPFAQDKHANPDASRSGTGYTDMDNGRQDERSIRDTDVEDERSIRDTDVEDNKQNEHHADLHVHKDDYVVVSYADKNSLHRLGFG